jgi:hypothetical protein
MCFNIFEPVYDQVQMASELHPHWMRNDVCSETSAMASKPTSINDLPDKMLQNILSHFVPEELCLTIAKVCQRWNALANDVVLWRTLSCNWGLSSNISHIKEVRCTILLGCRTNYLMNFAPSSVLKAQNLKENFRNLSSFHPELRQVSRGLHCVTPSGGF